MIRILERWRRDEAGTSLVLALIFLSILGVGTGALLSFGDASIRATLAIRTQGNNVYAAEGAVRMAINATRSQGSSGVYGQACPASPFASAGIGGVTPTVTCSALPGVPTLRTVPNAPPYTIMTLSTSTAEDGISSANQLVTVGGAIYSASTINGMAGGIHLTPASATATAHGACSGPISPSCTSGVPLLSDPGVIDGVSAPGYAPMAMPTSTAIAPTCVAGNPTFVPQTFTLLAQLNPAAGCSSGTLVFTPGAYYFNLGDNVWSPTSLVVGGTLTPDATTCDPTKPGVQFQFGGATRVFLGNSGRVRLCADPTDSTKQQIAIFGLRPVDAPSGFAAEGGCVTATVSGCLLLDTRGSALVDLEVTGTVYVPGAAVNLNVNNNATMALARGIIARSMAMNVGPNYPGVVASLPVPTNRVVLFTATLAGTTKLQAVVQFDDSVSGSPGATMTVQSWSVHR